MKIIGKVIFKDNEPASGFWVSIFYLGGNKPSEENISRAKPILEELTDKNGTFSLVYEGNDPSKLFVIMCVTTEDKKKILFKSKKQKLSNFSDNKTFQLDIAFSDFDSPNHNRKETGDTVSVLPRILRRKDKHNRKIRSEIKGSILQRLEEFDENRNARKRVTGNLLGRKPRTSGVLHRSFVPTGEDPTTVLQQAREDGIKLLGKSHNRRRGLTLLPASELSILLKGRQNIPIWEIAHHLEAGLNNSKSSTVEKLLLECEAEQQANAEIEQLKKKMEEGKNEEGKENPPLALDPDASATHPSDNEPASIEASLKRIIQKLQDVPKMMERATSETLAQNVKTQISAGPADVSAFYDVSTLQVAWRDVWTSVVDGLTLEEINQLYDTIVEVVPRDRVDANFSEAADLNELLTNLEEMEFIISDSVSVPSNLIGWISRIAEIWLDLSFFDQEYLLFLRHVDEYTTENATRDQLDWDGKPFEGPNDFLLSGIDAFNKYPEDWFPDLSVHEINAENWAYTQAVNYLDGLDLEETGANLGRAGRLIRRLKKKINQPYQFDVFVPNSYNFGIVTTYRQEWTPQTYQVGDLSGTLPLAPGERREFSTVRKRSRKQNSSQSSSQLFGGTSEQKETSRVEADIFRRAVQSTDTKHGFEFDVGMVSGKADFSGNQSSESQRKKNELREAVRTATQEYKDENKVEISTEATFEEEISSKQTIENPNNELTVTYLFYELQRQFEVQERLHNVKPVIMVAFQVPKPHKIDEAWLIEYSWILRKVLLDEALIPTLNGLTKSVAGDEVEVEILEVQWKTQLGVVTDLRRQARPQSGLRDEARDAVERALEDVAETSGQPTSIDFLPPGIGSAFAKALFRGNPQGEAQGEYEGPRQALDWADSDLARIDASLREGITALERATEAYLVAVRKQINQRTAIDQLILHVKDNILHYMQAIWMHEPADQRYLRLYNLEIQWPGYSGEAEVVGMFPGKAQSIGKGPLILDNMGTDGSEFQTLKIPTPEFKGEKRYLHEFADISKILGFHGNYALFGLKEANALTTYMAQDFFDSHFDLMDPDPNAAIHTTEEALRLARCAWSRKDISEDQRKEITEWLIDALKVAHSQSYKLSVPTGQLFIDALPGQHTLLEDFKLQHRMHDVEKAATDVQMAKIEALRRAKRLEKEDLSDPDVDKVVRIEGAKLGDTNIEVE
jgi:hypothetical protein